MGRKGGNINTKAQAAKEKKEANKLQKDIIKQKEKEKELEKEWLEGANLRGIKKRQEEERKRQQLDAQKNEKKLLEQLDNELVTNIIVNKSSVRKTKAQKSIDKPWEKALKDVPNTKSSKKTSNIVNNINKQVSNIADKNVKDLTEKTKTSLVIDEGYNDKGITFTDHLKTENLNKKLYSEGETATSIDAAIDILSTNNKREERHPEKRLKAAYRAFEEKMLPKLKEEYPNLKLSQYKERIFESWKKSPENPLNQETKAYNAS